MNLETVVENVTVADQIIQVLDDLCRKFGVVIDWASNNVIPYLLELMDKIVKYRLFCSWIYFGVFLTLFVIWIPVMRKYFKLINIGIDELKEDHRIISQIVYEIPIISFLILISFGITFLVLMIINIFNIGECYYFPEKAVFDFIKTYMRLHNL